MVRRYYRRRSYSRRGGLRRVIRKVMTGLKQHKYKSSNGSVIIGDNTTQFLLLEHWHDVQRGVARDERVGQKVFCKRLYYDVILQNTGNSPESIRVTTFISRHGTSQDGNSIPISGMWDPEDSILLRDWNFILDNTRGYNLKKFTWKVGVNKVKLWDDANGTSALRVFTKIQIGPSAANQTVHLEFTGTTTWNDMD